MALVHCRVPSPLIHCDLPLWGICHSIFWMRKHAVSQGHVLPLVIFVSALRSTERKTVLDPWYALHCAGGYAKSLIQIQFWMQEPLAIMLTFQKIQITRSDLKKSSGFGVSTVAQGMAPASIWVGSWAVRRHHVWKEMHFEAAAVV